LRYGEFKKGIISKTEGQVKKHYSQMSKEELMFLQDRLHSLNINDIEVSDHLQNKFIDKGIELKQIPFIDNLIPLIIEYNETPTRGFLDRRVLIRTTEKYIVNIKGKNKICNLCVVYSIVSGKVVTAYYNEANDNHDSINMNRYNKNLKVIY
jgi:hypothetical protein